MEYDRCGQTYIYNIKRMSQIGNVVADQQMQVIGEPFHKRVQHPFPGQGRLGQAGLQ